MSTTWQQLESQFDRLMRLPEARRQNQLHALKRERPGLARQLEALFAGADQTLGFSANTASEELLEAIQPGPGSLLKDYRLIKKLGQGGMGVVYLAHRETDYAQSVAIKLGRYSLDPEASTRFQRERQILAQLSHPNIAGLLDGGTTPGQTPYLVMEYIEGEQIDRYCRHHSTSLLQTLSMFRDVCLAVGHAHQHLVIHRDIKPSNILIQRDGTPRLLDFGIAKIIGAQPPDPETLTQAMTPAYVSPEQLHGKPVGTMTDVYALGLLLYELLTGQRAQDVSADNLSKLNRVVTEQEPTPLTHALKQAPGSITQAGLELTRQHRHWQRDLQNILKRALCKEPSRRYASAAALTADIDHLRSGNPVEASGDSLLYRLGKLARKYRYRFAAFSVATVSLFILAIGLMVLTLIANQARDNAQRRLSHSEALIQFLLGDLRSQLEPSVNLQVLDLLGETAMVYFQSLEPADQSDESLAQMALSLRQIGDIRLSQGRFSEGQTAFRRAMELTRSLYERNPGHNQRLFDLGQSYFWLGFTAHRQGDFDAARGPFRRYLEVSKSLVEREPRQLQWLLELSYAYNNLGTLDQMTGQLEDAREQFRRSLEIKRQLVRSDPANLEWKNELADTLAWLADTEVALGELHSASDYQQQRWDLANTLAREFPGHRYFQRSLGYASLALARQRLTLGQPDDAEALIKQSVDLADNLAAVDPQNLQWLEDATRARLELARLLILQHQQDAAHRWLAEAQQMAEHLISIPEPKPGWVLQLHARSAYLKLIGLVQATQSDRAASELAILQTRLNELKKIHPDDAYLGKLAAQVNLLDGDLSAQQCMKTRANELWRAALQPPQQVATVHPDELAIEAIALSRLQRYAAAAERIRRLSVIGYAEPWYTQTLGTDPASHCVTESATARIPHSAEPD